MTLSFQINTLLNSSEDRTGHMLVTLKDALVATGHWRVIGSSDNTTFHNLGQTAGLGGDKPWDVFTASPAWLSSSGGTQWATGGVRTVSRTNAWLVLQEIGTGRCWTFQRCFSSSSTHSALFGSRLSLGVATSGATATTPPAAVGASVVFTQNGNNPTWAEDSTNSASGVGGVDAQQAWMHLGWRTTPGAGGVCAWWMACVNRTTGALSAGGLYESLIDPDPALAHPLVAGFGHWSGLFGTVGNAALGPFHGGALYGADTLAAIRLERANRATAASAFVPGTDYRTISADGKWRTSRPVALQNATYLGQLEHFITNGVNRAYPTTYHVATPEPQPLLTLGSLLVRWKQGGNPAWTP